MSELNQNGIMPEIKIFVSHRIDINSELVDNPLYVPMRCGAVFDNENPMNIEGDDTGDNISEKRMSYCEFTVQYWAWKNAKADYYGLCHYRRYLAFDSKDHHVHKDDMMIHEPVLCDHSMKKYCISSEEAMKSVIIKYDAVVSRYIDVRCVPTPDGLKQTVGAMWDSFTGFSHNGKGCSEIVVGLIEEMFPEYLESAVSYMRGNKHRAFNCYVMKRELFNKMCDLQFPIMQRFSDMFSGLTTVEKYIRLPGYVGEMLNGIFLYHLERQSAYQIKECNIVFFHNTEHLSRCRWVGKQMKFFACSFFRTMLNVVLPKGSKQRIAIKKIFLKIGGSR